MLKRSAAVVAVLASTLVLASTPVRAQDPPEKPKPAEPAQPPRSQEPPATIKLELTITDLVGSGEPVRKTVSMVLADRGSGSIRSTGSARPQGRVQMNVDAQPYVISPGLIRLTLRLEYNPRTLGNESATEWSTVSEQIQTVVESGKSLMISQAVDPASDRKIVVDVKATVMK